MKRNLRSAGGVSKASTLPELPPAIPQTGAFPLFAQFLHHGTSGLLDVRQEAVIGYM
jgi:hypothetical protein